MQYNNHILTYYCTLLTSFKQECDYIYNDIMGFDANIGGKFLRSCGIKTNDFINLVLPFSEMNDVEFGTAGDRYIILNDGRHIETNIGYVVTQRRVSYTNRGNMDLEKEAVLRESENEIRTRGADALRASRYGDLPLYGVNVSMNLANLAWRVGENIRLRTVQIGYPAAFDLKIRKWKKSYVLCYKHIAELIVFPEIVVPLLKSYGVEEDSYISSIRMPYIKITPFNSEDKTRTAWKGNISSWNDKDILSYFPRYEWLKHSALHKMVAASTQPIEHWRRWGNERRAE